MKSKDVTKDEDGREEEVICCGPREISYPTTEDDVKERE